MNPIDVYTDVFYEPQDYNGNVTVRATHQPSGLYAESNKGRNHYVNREDAWHKLEGKVAIWEQGKATIDALAREFEEEIQRVAEEQIPPDYETSRPSTSAWPYANTKQEADDDYATLRKEFEEWALRFDINTAKTCKYADEAVEDSWQDFLSSKELY